jgi:hypothetical protein
MLVKAHLGVGLPPPVETKPCHPRWFLSWGHPSRGRGSSPYYPITIPINLQKIAQKRIQLSSKNTNLSICSITIPKKLPTSPIHPIPISINLLSFPYRRRIRHARHVARSCWSRRSCAAGSAGGRRGDVLLDGALDCLWAQLVLHGEISGDWSVSCGRSTINGGLKMGWKI